MRSLTPTIVLNFQSAHRVKETYRIVLKNVVEIAKTITDKHEVREAKLILMEAIEELKTTEERIWKRENKQY